jgi:hypothetical protein
VKLTLFSVEEANRAVIELRPALEELVHSKGELDRLQSSIDVHGLALAGATAENPDSKVLRIMMERRDRLAERLRNGAQAIQRRGCLIKDLDRGLVDFYSVAGDRLIFLCWQLGESEVTHWHTLEAGFAGRQRLDRAELE